MDPLHGPALADAYLEHLRRGGTDTPEAFLSERGESSHEVLELLRIASHLVEERPPGLGPGRRLGPYRILAEIGRGGMGTVYQARRVADGIGPSGKTVALKVVHPHLLPRRGVLERFLREAEAGRRVRHENVVPALDVGSADVDGCLTHYLVMEYVRGRTLRAFLRALGTVPEALVREIARQVAAGLAAIHQAGIVHRDLKPENLLLTEDHQVRIMDLGVARLVATSAALTGEGDFAGTLHYAAPEQFEGGDVGSAADRYALGIVLYELASGRNPFRHDETAASIRAHLERVPARLDAVGTDISPFLAEVVGTLLAKTPGDRFASTTALCEALRCAEDSSWWAEQEGRLASARRGLPRIDVRRRTGLHGRADDLAALRAAWARARSGGGGAVLLVGEAGIGKTRLVESFLREAGEVDATVLYGSYPPAGGEGGLSDAILTHFGSRLEASLRDLLSDVPTLVAPFVASLRSEPPPPGTEALTPDALHAVTVRLLQALAALRPLVWVVDDLHFARPESRRIAISLARGVAGHRALVLLTTRPELPEAEVAALGRMELLERREIARLTEAQVRELLQEALRSAPLAERLGARIAAWSDGIPFILFEILHSLEDGHHITQLADGSWVEARHVDTVEVPAAVRDLVAVRLQGLTQDERAVLDVAAVVGFEFDPDLIARVRGIQRLEVLEILSHLGRRSNLVRAQGDRFRFDHHHIQEVLHADLPDALRAEYHACLADVLVARVEGPQEGPPRVAPELAVLVATHYLRSSRPSGALPFLEPALRHLEAAQRNAELVQILERALAAPARLEEAARVDLQLRLVERLTLLGRREEVERVLDEAQALSEATEDPMLLGRTLGMRGLHLMQVDRHAEAEDALRRGRDAARAAGSKALEARILGTLASVLWYVGRGQESEEANKEQLRLAREVGDKRTETTAFVNLGNRYTGLGRFEEAIACEERAISLAPEAGYRFGEAAAVGNLGHVHFVLGNLEKALGYFRRHVEMTREIGYRHGEVMALVNLGSTISNLGDPEGARPWLEQSQYLAREIDTLSWHAYAHLPLSVVAEQEGNLAEARRHAAAAVDGLRRARSLEDLVPAGLRLGSLLAQAGESGAARTHLQDAATLSEQLGGPGCDVMCACHLAAHVCGPVSKAVAAFEAHRDGLGHGARMEACHLLWRATGDRAYLEEARRLLDDLVARAPRDRRDAMRTRVPLLRAILEPHLDEAG